MLIVVKENGKRPRKSYTFIPQELLFYVARRKKEEKLKEGQRNGKRKGRKVREGRELGRRREKIGYH